VEVNQKPTANAGVDKKICKGDSASLNAMGGSNYKWTPNNALSCTNCQSPKASPSSTTTYQVEIENSEGCQDTDKVKVEVNQKPTANAGADKEISRGNSVDLNAIGGNSYNWRPSKGLSCTNCQNPTASPDSTTVYTVTAEKANGCKNTDSVKIIVNDRTSVGKKMSISSFNVIPNPNSGKFFIEFYANQQAKTTIRIFDMKGEQIINKYLGLHKGKFSKDFDLEQFSNGVYNLQLIRDNKMLNKIIVIQ